MLDILKLEGRRLAKDIESSKKVVIEIRSIANALLQQKRWAIPNKDAKLTFSDISKLLDEKWEELIPTTATDHPGRQRWSELAEDRYDNGVACSTQTLRACLAELAKLSLKCWET